MNYSNDTLITIFRKAIPFLPEEDIKEFLSICVFKQHKNKEVVIRT